MPLITTTAEIKTYLPIDVNTRIETMLPFVNEAEICHMVPLLGNDFYNALLADYDVDQSNMTPDNQAIMPYVQRTIAYYMAYMSVPHISVNFGDMGIQQQHGENSSPAPLWKIDRLQNSYIQQADKHAEILLQYLEANASGTKYAEWFNDSAVNTKNEGYMVNTVTVADQYIDINGSRRLFQRLKKRIIEIETGHIRRLICAAQYAEIVSQIQSGTLTAENTALVEKLRPIITKMALYLTLPSIRVAITDQGITIFSATDGFNSKDIASGDQVKNLMKSIKEGPVGYDADESELQHFINENIDDYPLIEASDCYTIKSVPGPKWAPTNSATNKHFSV